MHHYLEVVDHLLSTATLILGLYPARTLRERDPLVVFVSTVHLSSALV